MQSLSRYNTVASARWFRASSSLHILTIALPPAFMSGYDSDEPSYPANRNRRELAAARKVAAGGVELKKDPGMWRGLG